MSEKQLWRPVGARVVVWALAVCLAMPAAAAKKPIGYVDGTWLIDLIGDDAVRLEVNISKSLIDMITAGDPDLKRLAGGLQSIYALILELDTAAAREKGRDAIRTIERRLVDEGWERVARVREEDAEIKVLVVNDGEAIQGLVILIVETDDDEPSLVFANLAGTVDLAAIRDIGEGFGVPGLRDLELDQPEKEGGK